MKSLLAVVVAALALSMVVVDHQCQAGKVRLGRANQVALKAKATYFMTSNGYNNLLKGEKLVSQSRRFTLVMQGDCNLVLYDDKRGKGGMDASAATWATGTWTPTKASCSAFLDRNNDGCLTVYINDHLAWTSPVSATKGKNMLVVQDDGNVLMYNDLGGPFFSTNSINRAAIDLRTNMMTTNGLSTLQQGQVLASTKGRFTLKMQTDCNLVLYDDKRGKGGQDPSAATWASGTSTTVKNVQCVAFLDKGGDGKLTVVVNNAVKWGSAASKTPGVGNSLVMQDDGNLVLYDNAGKPYWASGTWTQGASLILSS